MMYLHAFVEQQRFGSALFTVQGYLSGVDAADGELLDIHDQLVGISVSGRRFVQAFRDILNTVELSERDQQLLLASTEAYRAALAEVIGHREPIIRAHPESSAFWPDTLADEMEEVLDGLEDVVETLALGLSPQFRAEIAAARAAAGLPPE